MRSDVSSGAKNMGFCNNGLGQAFMRRVGFCSLLFSALASEANGQLLSPAKPAGCIRIATYNVSMNRRDAGSLAKDLAADIEGSQPGAVAAVIRTVKPDLLLLNEVDFDSKAENARQFEKRFLRREAKDLLGSGAWGFDFVFDAPVNTGVPSGLDLNKNQSKTDPEDAFGYGVFPGQYGMAVLSRFPLQEQAVVTMQKMLWASVPGALRPQVSASES